jgi:hypothetical protein
MMRTAALWGFAIALGTAQMAGADPVATSFSQMSVETGDRVTVISRSDTAVSGRIMSVSGTTLRLTTDGRTVDINESDVLRIERPGDSTWEGAVLGLAAGGGLGIVAAATCSECTGGEIVRGTLAFAAIGAGAGALVDFMISGRTRVFEAPSGTTRRLQFSPIIAADTQVLVATLSF